MTLKPILDFFVKFISNQPKVPAKTWDGTESCVRCNGSCVALKLRGLPPEKWSSLMYGSWPNGGLKNAKEETHG